MKIAWTILVLALSLAARGDAAATTFSKQQLRCALGLTPAGARLARAELDRFLACIDAIVRGKLPAGETAATCLQAESAATTTCARSR